jgi:hypothetical protein
MYLFTIVPSMLLTKPTKKKGKKNIGNIGK